MVISSIVEAALSRIEGNGQMVAVAGSFTMEGLALLEASKAIVVQLSEFAWTDDTYAAIHSKQRAR